MAQQVSVELAQAVQSEGNPGDLPTQFDFLVRRIGETDEALSVDWELRVAGTDPAELNDLVAGQATAGTVSFNAGQEQQTVSVLISGDLTVELDEQFALALVGNGLPAGTTLDNTSAVATISNDDPTVTISPSLAQALDEGNPGGSPATFSYTLTREGDLSQALTVDWQVTPQGNFQVDANDFGGILPSGTVTFEAGQSQATTPITFSASTDSAVEADEQFQVDLSLPASAPAGTLLELEEVSGRILNDDVAPLPELSIAALNAVQDEGNTGDDPPTAFTFAVWRTGDDPNQTSTVQWAARGSGPNAAGIDDFVSDSDTTGVLTFGPEFEEVQQITLLVNGDTDWEQHESFTVELSKPEGATLGLATAEGTIENDDVELRVISITPDHLSMVEGAEGEITNYEYTLTRSGDVEEQYSFVQVAFDPGDTEREDFEGGVYPLLEPQWVIFGPGDTEIELPPIGVSDDALDEFPETFTLTLERAVNATLNPQASTATGTIENDDEPMASVITGSAGDDVIIPEYVSNDVTGDKPSEADDTIDALGGDDIVSGGGGADTIEGGGGNDVLLGGEGNDTLDGGDDDDTLDGGEGNDTLDGGKGDDELRGGGGADTLDGGGGNDRLEGGGFPGSGAAVFAFAGANGADTITDFENGVDRIDFTAYAVSDVSDFSIVPEQANTLISGYNGAGNTITLRNFDPANLGNDDFIFPNVITGSDNDDLILPGFVSGEVTGGEPSDADDFIDALGGNDLVSGGGGQDSIEGGAGQDMLLGGEGNDTLDGGDGNDTLVGGDGNDTLDGGAGNDTLRGGDDDDTLLGGDGNDTLDGGNGADTHVFAGNNGVDTISDFTDASDRIDFTQYAVSDVSEFSIVADGSNTVISGYADAGNSITLENFDPANLGNDDFIFPNVITGSDNDDLILPGFVSGEVTGGKPSDADDSIDALGGNDLVSGGGGQDSIKGGAGQDTLLGGEGNDTLDGGDDDDTLDGGEGNDTLDGGKGDDELRGGGGADTLDGGGGNDRLEGGGFPGSGAAVFAFAGANGADTITDFENGVDRIDFTAYAVSDVSDFSIVPEQANTLISGYNGAGNTITLRNIAPASLGNGDFIFAGGNSIYISDVQVEEGQGGSTTDAVFTVSLSTPVAETVTVDYATADGTATAGSDYTAVDGTLTFAPGETVQEVRVPITGDGDVELNESFFVNLTNPVNDVIADGQGEATILDDDGSGVDKTGTSADEVLDGDDGDDVLQGGNGDDALSGAEGDDALTGGSGDDALDGGTGDDILAGGSDDDTLHGDAGDDVLGGGSGNDELEGGADNDTLVGGSGDDQLSGGGGDDALIGGSGSDTFVFRAADGDSGHDTIRLFNAAEDTLAFEDYGERLDAFSDLDTSRNNVLDDGDDHVSVAAGNTVIDIGGQTDGISEGTLTLVGVTGLVADDFSFS